MQQGEHEEALGGFTAAIKLSEEPNAMLHVCQAEAYTKLADYQSAMASAKQALAVDPLEGKAITLMGKLMVMEGDLIEAFMSIYGNYDYYTLTVMEGNAEDAIGMLSDAVEAGERSFVVLFSLACALQDKAMQLLPKWTIDLAERAVQQAEFRDTIDEAIKTYKLALTVEQNGQAACNVATALLGQRKGRKKEIEMQQDDIKRDAPEAPNEQELRTIGEALMVCGSQFKSEITLLESEALEFLDRALDLNGADLLAQMHHASLLLEMDKPQTAITSFRKGITMIQGLAEMRQGNGKLTGLALEWIGEVCMERSNYSTYVHIWELSLL